MVEISLGNRYSLEPLIRSHFYVTTNSKRVLKEMGLMYEIMADKGNFFSVSSATRTMDQQVKLNKRNRNATAGNSSHSYGVSFDISYIRFNGVKAWDSKAKNLLKKFFITFRK